MKRCHKVPFGHCPRGCPVPFIIPGSPIKNLRIVSGWYRAFPA